MNVELVKVEGGVGRIEKVMLTVEAGNRKVLFRYYK